MDADEREIVDFLRSWQGRYVSAKEIAKRAGGKWRFRKEPNWAAPVLARLVERREIEADATGHFRLLEREKQGKHKWISPQIQAILDKSAQQTDGVVSMDEEGNETPKPPEE
jgi:hypothetical protein